MSISDLEKALMPRDILGGDDVATLSALFDALVIGASPAFSAPRDPVLGCRRFVWEPELGFENVFPVYGNEVLAWEHPPSAHVREILSRDECDGRVRENSLLGLTDRQIEMLDQFYLMRHGVGPKVPYRVIDDRPVDFRKGKRSARYELFDDLEFEFLLRISGILRAVSGETGLNEEEVLLLATRPGYADNARVVLHSEIVFRGPLMIDFERCEIHTLTNRYPASWSLIGLRVTAFRRNAFPNLADELVDTSIETAIPARARAMFGTSDPASAVPAGTTIADNANASARDLELAACSTAKDIFELWLSRQSEAGIHLARESRPLKVAREISRLPSYSAALYRLELQADKAGLFGVDALRKAVEAWRENERGKELDANKPSAPGNIHRLNLSG